MKRLTKAVLAALAITSGAAAVAPLPFDVSPVRAHHTNVTGTSTCINPETKQSTVTWSVTNPDEDWQPGGPAELQSNRGVTFSPNPLSKGATATAVEVVTWGSGGTNIAIQVTATFSNGQKPKNNAVVMRPANCTPTTTTTQQPTTTTTIPVTTTEPDIEPCPYDPDLPIDSDECVEPTTTTQQSTTTTQQSTTTTQQPTTTLPPDGAEPTPYYGEQCVNGTADRGVSFANTNVYQPTTWTVTTKHANGSEDTESFTTSPNDTDNRWYLVGDTITVTWTYKGEEHSVTFGPSDPCYVPPTTNPGTNTPTTTPGTTPTVPEEPITSPETPSTVNTGIVPLPTAPAIVPPAPTPTDEPTVPPVVDLPVTGGSNGRLVFWATALLVLGAAAAIFASRRRLATVDTDEDDAI